MKRIKRLLIMLITLIIIDLSLITTINAVRRRRSYKTVKKKNVFGICTHHVPQFIEKKMPKKVYDDDGEQPTKSVIDIGDGQEIPADKDFDSEYLSSTDNRIGIDYDIKTRRVYQCKDINDPEVLNELQVECEQRGYNHGMLTDGTKKCFKTW